MKDSSKTLKIEELENRKQIQEFVANLEKGDLGLSEFIEYGYVVYGQTRTGKTATCHLLSGNALKGQKIKGEDMVELATSKNRKAVIGNTMNSETVIPNFFEIKPFTKQNKQNSNEKQFMNQLNGKTFVIDTPGYGDTYGVLRILANGYFHYRLYSRVKNMKFILCFDANQLKNTADRFVHTITEFTSYFKDYLQKKQEIWKCCVFLITKVDQNEQNLEDLYEKLIAIAGAIKTQLRRDTENAIRQFIRFIVKQKRVFCIKKFKKGESCTTGHLLSQIDQAIPEWWSRPMSGDRKEVDMDPIVFSLAKPITISTTSNDLSQRQFAQLTKYYNIRIKEIVKGTIQNVSTDDDDNYGLSFVLNQLVKDAMGSPDDRNFLTVMQKYITKYYWQLDNSYKDDRQKMQRELFYQDPSSLSQKQKGAYKKFQIKDKNYLVKKFNSLKQIEKLKQQINNLDFVERNLDWLEKSQIYLYQMIKSLSKISYKKHNATQIIFKYGYLIHRIVQQAKLFLVLTKLSAGPEGQKRLKQAADDQFIDLMRLLKDFMGLPYVYRQKQIHSEDLHLMFIKSFQLQDSKYKKLQVNESLIDFFCNTETPPEEDDIEKITKLILRFSQQYLESGEQKPTLATKSTQKLLIRLLTARSNCESTYYLKQDSQDDKMNQIFLIRRTTQQLGNLLHHLKKYDLARKVFKTVRYVQSVSQLYQKQLQQLKIINQKHRTNSSTERQFQLRLQFSDYLSNHYRQHQAMQLLQQTFQLAKNKEQLQIVKNQLTELMLKMNDKSATNQYSEKLFNSEYFEQLGEELEGEISNVVQNCNPVI